MYISSESDRFGVWTKRGKWMTQQEISDPVG